MKKYRTAITIPDKVAEKLKNISKETGKSVNSLIIESCIDYLKKFNQEYPFLFEKSHDKEERDNGDEI